MTSGAAVLAVLAVGVYLLKSAGPLLLGGRELPTWLGRLADQLPAALLAAFVVVATVAVGGDLAVDAKLVGVTAAAIALWRRAPFLVVVVVACAATSGARLLG